MAIDIFKYRFGKDPIEFSSTRGIDCFVEGKLGRKLEVRYMHPDISTCRGSVFPVKDLDADEIFESALKK